MAAAPVIATLFWLVIRLVASVIWAGATLAEITGETVVLIAEVLGGERQVLGVDLAVAIGVGVEGVLAGRVAGVGVQRVLDGVDVRLVDRANAVGVAGQVEADQDLAGGLADRWPRR